MALVTDIKQYRVLFTPLVDQDVYGSELDVTKDVDLSDYVRDGGIGKIKQEIDNGDYDIGVFSYGNITLKCFNINGKFNDESDWRSIFNYTRDKCKVSVDFLDNDGDVLSSFRGIINDEATRQNFKKDEVKFKVLSNDSVIRKTKVSSGVVPSGALFSTAIKNILNVPEITSVLNYDPANVNVKKDLTIDVGSWFDNKKAKEALDALMVVSNSVMHVDLTGTIYVRSREENSGEVFTFYGHGDVFGRENILQIKNLNTGLQRSFNSVVINDTEVSNQVYADLYGSRQKKLDFEFVTDGDTELSIANEILESFQVPKMELEIVATTSIVKELNLFDLVSIDYPYRVKPYEGRSTLDQYGQAIYGQAVYPYISGNMKIRPLQAFKVIGKTEDPKKFLTAVKLRQRGETLSDGLFSNIATMYGFAIYGEHVYQQDIDRLDPNRISVFGAGIYGTVLYRA